MSTRWLKRLVFGCIPVLMSLVSVAFYSERGVVGLLVILVFVLGYAFGMRIENQIDKP